MVNTLRASQNSISSNNISNSHTQSTTSSQPHQATNAQSTPGLLTNTPCQNFIRNNKDIININNVIDRHLIDESLNNIYHEKSIRIPDCITNKIESFCGLLARELRGPFVTSVIDAANSLDYNQLEKFIECDSYVRAQHFLDNPVIYRKEMHAETQYIDKIRCLKEQFNFISMRINNVINIVPAGAYIAPLVSIIAGVSFYWYRNSNSKWEADKVNIITIAISGVATLITLLISNNVIQRNKNNDEIFKIAKNIFIKRKEGMDILNNNIIINNNNTPHDNFKLNINLQPTTP